MFAARHPARHALSRAAGSGLESQSAMAAALADSIIRCADQLNDLNMNLVQATLEQSTLAARQTMSAEDMHDMFSQVSAQIQPNARRAFDYGYYLTTLVCGTQLDIAELLADRIADSGRNFLALAEEAGASVPVDFHTTAALIKSILGAAGLGEPQQGTEDNVSVWRTDMDVAISRLAYAGGTILAIKH
jgi:phasin family protein